jgi:group I intron endonuclease
MAIVYLTKNLINGKKYIGSHKDNNPKYLGSGVILSKAIKKYGRDSFERVTLWEGPEEDRYDLETLICETLNVQFDKNYYNCTNKGTGLPKGFKHTQEVLDKYKEVKQSRLAQVRESKIGDWIQSENGQKHIKELNKKINSDPNVIVKRTESLKQRYATQEHHLKGVPKTEEWKNSRKKAIEVLTPSGELVVYESGKQLIEETGINPQLLHKNLKEGTPINKGPFEGYSFKYK